MEFVVMVVALLAILITHWRLVEKEERPYIARLNRDMGLTGSFRIKTDENGEICGPYPGDIFPGFPEYRKPNQKEKK